MTYYVFEDLDDADDTKVHSAECRWFVSRKPNATTTRWHGPFETHREATTTARSIAERKRHGFRDCQHCLG